MDKIEIRTAGTKDLIPKSNLGLKAESINYSLFGELMDFDLELPMHQNLQVTGLLLDLSKVVLLIPKILQLYQNQFDILQHDHHHLKVPEFLIQNRKILLEIADVVK